jgi:hypothetical protein
VSLRPTASDFGQERTPCLPAPHGAPSRADQLSVTAIDVGYGREVIYAPTSPKLMQAITRMGAISSGRRVTDQTSGTYAIYAAMKKK